MQNIVTVLNATELYALNWLMVNLLLCDFYFKQQEKRYKVSLNWGKYQKWVPAFMFWSSILASPRAAGRRQWPGSDARTMMSFF